VLGAIRVTIAIIVRARRPSGALEVAGEGPALGARPALGEGVKLAFFTAEGCRLCRALLPQAERLGAVIFDEVTDAAAWTAADLPAPPSRSPWQPTARCSRRAPSTRAGSWPPFPRRREPVTARTPSRG